MKTLQVLLAEDNVGDVFLVKEALRCNRIEHELRVLRDGIEATRYLATMGSAPETPCPDIFLVDLNLPSGDGHELVEQFRSHPQCKNVPVIVVTSSDAPQDRLRAKRVGANAYFRKPSSLAEFMQLGTLVANSIRDPQRHYL